MYFPAAPTGLISLPHIRKIGVIAEDVPNRTLSRKTLISQIVSQIAADRSKNGRPKTKVSGHAAAARKKLAKSMLTESRFAGVFGRSATAPGIYCTGAATVIGHF